MSLQSYLSHVFSLRIETLFKTDLSSKYLVLSEFLRLALGLLTIVLLERILGAETLGGYLSITVMTQIMARVLDFGLPHGIGYYLRVDQGSVRNIVMVTALHSFAVAPIAAALVFLIGFFPFANIESRDIFHEIGWVIALLALSELVANLGRAIFIPRKQFGAHLAINALTPISFLALVWTDVVSKGADGVFAHDLVLNMARSAAFTAALVAFVLLVSVTLSPMGKTNFRDLYTYSSKAYGSALSKVIAQKFDRLLLISLLGASSYALYSVSVSLRDMIVFPAQSYALALRNRQIDMIVHARRVDKARRLLLRTTTLWIAIGTIVSFLMIPIWPIIVGFLFSPDFASISSFTQILTFTCGPLAAMSVAWNHLYALNLPGRVFVLTILSLLVSVPIFVFFIHFFEATFAAAAASLVWSILSVSTAVIWAAKGSDIEHRSGEVDA